MLSGDRQCRNGCRRSGDYFHRHTQLMTKLHQRLTRVGNTGHACICDHAAGFPCEDPVGNALCHCQPAVFVVADNGCVNVIVGEQLAGDTGVLRRQKVHLAQQPQLPHSDVLQISDGRADDV